MDKITNPGVQAEIVNLAASLRRAQRRFEDAHRLIDLSIQLDHEAGEQHGVGEKMLVKSQIYYFEGRLGEAITIAQAALGRLDPQRDERSHLCAEHALLCYLADAGLFEQSRQRFEELESVYERFADDPAMRLRRWWLEGRIAQGTGALELAESRLAAARDAFLAHGNGYDAALVVTAAAKLALSGREDLRTPPHVRRRLVVDLGGGCPPSEGAAGASSQGGDRDDRSLGGARREPALDRSPTGGERGDGAVPPSPAG